MAWHAFLRSSYRWLWIVGAASWQVGMVMAGPVLAHRCRDTGCHSRSIFLVGHPAGGCRLRDERMGEQMNETIVNRGRNALRKENSLESLWESSC